MPRFLQIGGREFNFSVGDWIVLNHEAIGIEIRAQVSKVSNYGRGWPEGSLFNSYYTEVKRRALLLSALLLILTL